MKRKSQLRTLVAFCAMFSATQMSYGESAKNPEKQEAKRQEMIERHKKVAEMHLKAATCLQSDKTIAQCRQEMIEDCRSTMGNNCPMMGNGQGKMGRQGKGMMNGGGGMGWMMEDTDSTEKESPKERK
jgi:hypothetical protein